MFNSNPCMYIAITDRKLIGKDVLKEDEIVFCRRECCKIGRKVVMAPTIWHSSCVDSIPVLTACENPEIFEALGRYPKDAYLTVISVSAARKIAADWDGDCVILLPLTDEEDIDIYEKNEQSLALLASKLL